MKLKIGILQADNVLPPLAEGYGEYPEMFQQLLLAANSNQQLQLEFATYAVNLGIYPEDIDEVDAYIMTGSKSSVYEDTPWVTQLAEFVKSIHSHKKKFIGICFGHQMVAHALGGEAGLAAVGWSLGVKQASPNPAPGKNLLADQPFKLIYSHQDQVIKPVPGSVILASTDNCPIAATSLGEHILTFQGHPEFFPEYTRALYQLRRQAYPADTYKNAMASIQENADQTLVGKIIIDFCLA